MRSFLHGPVPASLDPSVRFIPLLGVVVPAGFPSPASDWEEDRVDLNQHYITHPDATYYFTVSGDSMVNANSARSIPDGSLLIVDRARDARHDDIVVAVIDGDFTVKRLFQQGNHLALLAENPAYPPIIIGNEQELTIWGVATACVARLI